jgi:mono/diheme cytochrome c family protein
VPVAETQAVLSSDHTRRKEWTVIRQIATAAAVYVFALSTALLPAQPQQDGKSIFRFDTFGSEQLWTDVLQMQHVVSEQVSPATALSVGLKVDVDALPPAVIAALQAGQVNLNDPAVTVQLLKLNAVVGVIGKVVGKNDTLATVGITCALCHSTVDDSFAPGIGKRLDGWANTTLNAGAIIALSPAISDKNSYRSWGPGKYDPRFRIFDGTNVVQINSPTLPVVIPPVFGLKGVGFETFNGDGPISYWNNYVGVTQMGGQGSFSDPRIGVTVTQTPDLVTPKLPALLQYQLSLQTPTAPSGTINRAAARRGADLFAGTAGCANCHKPPLFTDVTSGANPAVPFLHDPSDIPTDPAYAARSATKAWRTTPLRALWQHAPYFHDGSAADLLAVVNRYNNDPRFRLGLTARQKADLVEFLKGL